MPGAKQACPTRAACWSPATPRIGMAAPSTSAALSPKSPALSRTCGSRAAGTSNSASKVLSHWPSWMFRSWVREALVASVASTLPPVSRHSRKLSTVPQASSPASARARAPGTLSRIQAILVAEK